LHASVNRPHDGRIQKGASSRTGSLRARAALPRAAERKKTYDWARTFRMSMWRSDPKSRLCWGLYSRVGRQLGVDPSYVSRVAHGKRHSPKIERKLNAEIAR